ncbi:MAG: hypothetical protein KatS3mg003_2083 [Candidatus Nitrosocaldaceae archaeon]|nr:MAG: hypothetical protein KatS3mg003_2083 [Candidatus Nitrosocaldaceae archaeon]
MKVSKVALKLELRPFNDNLDYIFEEYDKLVLLLNQFVSRLWFIISDEFERDDKNKIKSSNIRYNPITRKYLKLFKDVCKLANINIHVDILEETFSQVLTLYINAYNSGGSKPILTKFKNSIPLRLKKNGTAGNLKLVYNDGLFAEYTLGNRNKPIKGRALIALNKDLISERLSDAKIGDPSNLIMDNGRYYLYLSASKNVNLLNYKKLSKLKKIRIVGVDFGVSDYIAAMFCIEIENNENKLKYRLVNAKLIDSKEYLKILNSIDKYNRKRMSYSKSKGSISRKTKDGKSLRVTSREQLTGRVINEIIKFAKDNNAEAIAVENLKSLQYRLKANKLRKKALGIAYNYFNRGKRGKKSCMIKLKQLKAYDIMTKLKNSNKQLILKERRITNKHNQILSMLPYGKLFKDLENEAKWNGGLFISQVSAYHTSQRCSVCGYEDNSNRESRSMFRCKSCGWRMNADLNASINIALNLAEKIYNKEVERVRVKALTPTSNINVGSSPLSRIREHTSSHDESSHIDEGRVSQTEHYVSPSLNEKVSEGLYASNRGNGG